jgi:acyl-coenzyme A thioesterase PaaI-like protein
MDGRRDPLARPEGSTLDLARVHAVATTTNRAHHALGTELLALERHGATVGLAWRADLADVADGGLSAGVLACLLDHACSLAALMSADDVVRPGSTMGLRVDHLAAPRPGAAVHVVAECVGRADRVLFVRGEVRDPSEPGRLLAVGTGTVARAAL